jgi:hypothetical protein
MHLGFQLISNHGSKPAGICISTIALDSEVVLEDHGGH